MTDMMIWRPECARPACCRRADWTAVSPQGGRLNVCDGHRETFNLPDDVFNMDIEWSQMPGTTFVPVETKVVPR